MNIEASVSSIRDRGPSVGIDEYQCSTKWHIFMIKISSLEGESVEY